MVENQEYAISHHEREANLGVKIGDTARESAMQALKSVLLINGGAAIALLAFVGSALTDDAQSMAIQPVKLVAAVTWFAWGVAAAVMAMAFTYGTLYCAAHRSHSWDRSWEYPYLVETKQTRRWLITGYWFEALAVAFGLLALICFCIGIWAVKEAVISGVMP